ncbi:MAG: hypothetical protein CMO55_25270 [Verrucomicrobiales bacterium]|nr:hypothetical protein [Verrucomicrobiales bacterium]
MKSIFVSFGLQRSGQHLMIEWICRGLLPDTLHLNHCVFFRDGLSFKLTPFNGRRVIYCNETIDDSGAQGQSDFNKSLPYPSPQHLFFSLEDRSPEENDEKAFIKSHNPFLVFFLRDPANWLASGLRHGLHDPESLRDNKEILKLYLEIALKHKQLNSKYIDINYNRFCQDIQYRSKLSTCFKPFNFKHAEHALEKIAKFGGGSSFSNGATSSSNTFDRWRDYEHDETFRSILNDRKLLELSQNYFGDIPAISFLSKVTED